MAQAWLPVGGVGSSPGWPQAGCLREDVADCAITFQPSVKTIRVTGANGVLRSVGVGGSATDRIAFYLPV